MEEKFARWDMLFMQYVKRDWKKIIIWILGLGLFSAGFVPAFKEIAKGQGLIGMFETLQNPAMISMVGPTPIKESASYTLGAMYAHEMLLFSCLFTMVIAILHVIGHTRKEEDQGLTEMIRSFPVGRQANSFAVMIEIIFIHLLLMIFISGLMISFNAETITVVGSLVFGASISVAGVMGGALALLMAQIMPTSASATGSTLGLIGLLYIIRAGTDMSNLTLSMVNPLGWTYLTYPFTENNWAPLFYSFLFILVLLVLAFVLGGARDIGAGYLPTKEGRAYAKHSLLSVRGLLLKLNQGVIITWLITFFVLGAAYGSIYGDMQSFLESNDMLQEMFSHAGVTIEASFTGTIMIVMIALVSILPIVLINKLYAEENRSRLSQIFATQVSRAQLYWITIMLAFVTGVIGILLVALGLGGTAIMMMGDTATMDLGDFLASGLNTLPIVLFFIGLAALALGWLPKLGKVVYVYLVYSFLLNYFEGILDLPNWFLKTAIQSWIPNMPMESFKLTIFMIVTVVSIGMIFIGFIGYKNRDMQESA